jgi:hypothetical protein
MVAGGVGYWFGWHVSGWTNPPRDQFTARGVTLIRAVRDYRLQHPWTSDEPEKVKRLQKASQLINQHDCQAPAIEPQGGRGGKWYRQKSDMVCPDQGKCLWQRKSRNFSMDKSALPI